MKTRKISAILVLLLTIVFLSEAAVEVPGLSPSPENNSAREKTVRAIYSDGVWIPVVDLPEFEVIGYRTQTKILHAEMKNGTLVAMADLPAVEISAARKHVKSAAKNSGNTFEAINDIPVIDVVDDFPVKSLVKTATNESGTIAVVDLPEITVTPGSSSENQFTSLESILASFKLATKQLSDIPTAMNLIAKQIPDVHNISKNYVVSVENCLKVNTGNKICAVFVTLQSSAANGMKVTINEMIPR